MAELDLLRFIRAETSRVPQLDRLLKSVDDVLAWYRMASLNWPIHAKHPRGMREQRIDLVEPWLVRLIALLDALSDTAVREVLQRLSLGGQHAATVQAARAARHLLPRLALWTASGR